MQDLPRASTMSPRCTYWPDAKDPYLKIRWLVQLPLAFKLVESNIRFSTWGDACKQIGAVQAAMQRYIHIRRHEGLSTFHLLEADGLLQLKHTTASWFAQGLRCVALERMC